MPGWWEGETCPHVQTGPDVAVKTKMKRQMIRQHVGLPVPT